MTILLSRSCTNILGPEQTRGNTCISFRHFVMANIKNTVPQNLPALVKAHFNAARSNSDLNFYPTQVLLLNVNSVPFQVRYSPSLAKKPKFAPSSKNYQEPRKTFDPFERPDPALVISYLPSTRHVLVLNKFAIVQEHFILATEAFARQTELLTRGDLEAAWECIKAYWDYQGEHETDVEGGELFVFYNSGEHSGASQAHRHLQLLPVGRMREGLPEDGGWEVLADLLVESHGKKMPFMTFAERIGDMTSEGLLKTYLRLYTLACEASGLQITPILAEEVHEQGVESRISYNMALTRRAMVLCPRISEGAAVVRNGEEVGKLAVNGTVLAGTAIVKSEKEWEALRADPAQLESVLRRIGLE